MIGAARRAIQQFRHRAEQRVVARHTSRYEDTILFTQGVRLVWPHLWPLVAEVARRRPSACLLILTSMEDYPFVSAQPVCREFPQVLAATALPVVLPNLRIAFSMSPDNRLQLPHGFTLALSVVKCVLQHGLADKTLFGEDYEEKPAHDYDVFFLAGPVFREGSLVSYCAQYPGFLATRTVLEAGLCRTDSLVRAAGENGEPGHEDTAKPPTILYAPTWTPGASLEALGDEILERLCAFEGNVVIRPHAMSLMPGDTICGMPRRRPGEDWIGLLESLQQQHSHVRFSRGPEPDADYLEADVMISDVSGAAFEFMLLDRPVVFVDVPEFFRRYGNTGVQYWGRDAGDIVSRVEQLLPTVRLNLDNPQRKSAERAALRARLLYNPGHAAEVSARWICEILDDPAHFLKRRV